MGRTREKPVRDLRNGSFEDYRETHPAYAMIGASRVSSTPGASLFGSDFLHQHYMTITIRRASLSRGLASDHMFSSGELIEVALSEAQWATFVSTPNMGHGVGCTLEWLKDEGYVAAIEPITNRREQHNAEIQDTLTNTLASLEAALGQAKTKAQRDPISMAITQLKSNLDFLAERFDEHAEKTVERAKMEVNAYITQSFQRVGIEALGGTPLLELAEPSTAKEVVEGE